MSENNQYGMGFKIFAGFFAALVVAHLTTDLEEKASDWYNKQWGNASGNVDVKQVPSAPGVVDMGPVLKQFEDMAIYQKLCVEGLSEDFCGVCAVAISDSFSDYPVQETTMEQQFEQCVLDGRAARDLQEEIERRQRAIPKPQPPTPVDPNVQEYTA